MSFLAVLAVLVLGAAAALAQALPEKASLNGTSNEMGGLSGESAAKPPKPFDWVDTSSPRRVLESLLAGTQRYNNLLHKDGFTRQNWRELTNISEQAERLFDLRGVPPGHSHDVAHETAVLLREALARVPLSALDEVPDEDSMAARIRDGKSSRYRVRGTPFEIARTDTGPDAGRYQFTHDTVVHARDFYEEIKAYPYQPGQADIEGYYGAYFLSPGPLLSRAWFRSLPKWMQYEFLQQTVWQWLFLIASAGLFIAAIYLLHIGVNRVSRDWQRLNRSLILLLRPIAAILLAFNLEGFLDDDVRLTGDVARVVETGKHLIILFASLVVTLELGDVLAELILTALRFERRQIDQQLVRLFVRLLSVVVAVVIVIEEMQQIGISVATLVAGAGVSGLAIALAGQNTLRNIFGGIELSLDKPFAVGQRVIMKGYDGEIEEIGLRSTKIRTLNGHQVIIPNEDAAKLDIENIGRRPYIRRCFNVTIRSDTSPDKINRAVEIARHILAVPESRDKPADKVGSKTATTGATELDGSHHRNAAINRPDFPPRVYFNEIKSDALNLLIIYWYHPPVYWDYLEHAHWVNLQIVERYNAEGIEFSLPGRLYYYADDEKRTTTSNQGRTPADKTGSPQAAVTSALTVRPSSPAAESVHSKTNNDAGPNGTPFEK